GASSVGAGIEKNIVYGLGTFNANVRDHGWEYLDIGHGIVDPLTGVLLWLGVGTVIVQLIRRRGPPWPLLLVAGFLVLCLAFTFLVNEAPHYTRLLVTLPLVAGLAAVGVRTVATVVGGAVLRPGPGSVASVATAAVVALGAWNGVIAWDYIRMGRAQGDDV